VQPVQTQNNNYTQGDTGGSTNATLHGLDEDACTICKFMGLWPTERTLHNWIKYHWKKNGEVELHLGSKGFFIVVFMNLEDRDRVLEGGPYFHSLARLYMRPWKENFSPEKETFKEVSVWQIFYSLPLDY
jgi:hypothetical protein